MGLDSKNFHCSSWCLLSLSVASPSIDVMRFSRPPSPWLYSISLPLPLFRWEFPAPNTNEWKEVCAEVTNGRFGSHGPGGSDIWILNTDKEDDILGALEIADVSLDEIALKSCDFHVAIN